MKKKLLIIFVSIICIYYISYNDKSITKVIKYNGNELRINIDGDSANTLPVSGNYYLIDYDCKNPNIEIKWDKNNYKLDIYNNSKKGEVICNLEFKSKPLLSEMKQGSYVKYIGNNGCDDTNEVNGWTSCEGKNANYASDIETGYCGTGSSISRGYKFYTNGWRIAYIDNENVHLISAGAPECMCSNSSGVASTVSCDSDSTAGNLYKHYESMNKLSFKYCNENYVKNGICITNSTDSNVNTIWTLNVKDFKKMTGKDLNHSSCSGSSIANRYACGFDNDLIDNGGYYWFANSDGYIGSWCWLANYRAITNWNSHNLFGVRPVIALDSSVFVFGGDGTYESPYEISNYNFRIIDDDGYITDNSSKSNVQLNLIGSDVSTMCISVNTSVCTNYIDYSNNYTLDLSNELDGEKFIYVYYKDADGNIVASMNKSIIINTDS